MKVLPSLLEKHSGSYWVSSGGANCTAALVRRGQLVKVVSVPCRDKLNGFACRYESNEVCNVLNVYALATYTINTTARFQVLSTDSFPPGTVALPGVAQQHPDSKYLCFGTWFPAPWGCEVMKGGCEHDCDPSATICTCRTAHALHPNGFSCVRESPPEKCGLGYEPAAFDEGCMDVDECEEDVCTAERKECVNVPGGYTCTCAHGFAEEDGVCVNVSICLSCEQNCVKVNGVFRCSCMEGFTVVPEDPTKCRQSCSGAVCRALCLHDPRLEKKDMQQCMCPDGYVVDINNGTASCVDINECEHQEMCDHRCENTFGSYRCVCEEGFRLEGDDRCVSEERGGSSESPIPLVPDAPESLQPDVLPSYIKTGSIMGITVFLVLCVVLLGFLVQNMTRRCGRLDLTSLKSPDIDIFHLQQVSTETYKRLSDKQSVTDSLRL